MLSSKRLRGALFPAGGSKNKESQSNESPVIILPEDYVAYKNNKYDVLLPPIGMGGFSNVLAVKHARRRWRPQSLSFVSLTRLRRNKSFAEKLDSYPLAAKVCELNSENVHVNEDNCLKPLRGGRNVNDYVMQVAELKELQEEARIMKELQGSDLIVKLHETFEYTPNEQYWMVMERLTTNLSDLTRNAIWKTSPAASIARICVLREALEALVYLKEKRIVHGDIKPGNILVDITGAVKLCDFGIAKQLSPDGGKLIVVEAQKGSLPYMAPELFIEGYEYDYAIDVWAFGCVAYSTFTQNGVSPFHTTSIRGTNFDKFQWERWEEGDGRYFEVVLGPGFVSQEERDEMRVEYLRKRRDHMSPEDVIALKKFFVEPDKKSNVFYAQNLDRIEFLRSALIPYPLRGPESTFDREMTQERASIEGLKMMAFLQPGDDIVDHQGRQDKIREVLKLEHIKS